MRRKDDQPVHHVLDDTELPSVEPASTSQEFSSFMRELIGQSGARTVVEVGPDMGLERAEQIAPVCDRYYAVALQDDVDRIMFNTFNSRPENVELIAGNAVDLSTIVPKADIVFAHNVFLDLTGHDTAKLWRYRRGQESYTDEDWERLRGNYSEVRRRAFLEYLKVADPGRIIIFQRTETAEDDKTDELIREIGKIPEERIRKVDLLYDDNESDDSWVAYVIDNT